MQGWEEGRIAHRRTWLDWHESLIVGRAGGAARSHQASHDRPPRLAKSGFGGFRLIITRNDMGRLRRDATLSGPNYRFRRACDRVVTLCCQGSRLSHYWCLTPIDGGRKSYKKLMEKSNNNRFEKCPGTIVRLGEARRLVPVPSKTNGR